MPPAPPPLYAAAQSGNVEQLKMLISRGGPNVNNPCHANQDWTPAIIAARNGHNTVLQILIEHGADVRVTNARGFTPLHIAAEFGQEDCLETLIDEASRIKRKKKLLEAMTQTGEHTALHLAVQHGQDGAIEVLLDHGASTEAVSSTGHTALHYAAHLGNNVAVEILLAAMANSAAVSNKGGTPLFYAAMNGHVGCVHQLLLSGSDPHVETEWGTAEQQAQLKGHTAVVELLRNPPTMEAPQMPTLLVMNEEANE